MGFSIATPTPKTTTETITPCSLPHEATEGKPEVLVEASRARSEAMDLCWTTAKQKSPTAPNCTARIAAKYDDYTRYRLGDEMTITCTSEDPTETPIQSLSPEFLEIIPKEKRMIPPQDFTFPDYNTLDERELFTVPKEKQ